MDASLLLGSYPEGGDPSRTTSIVKMLPIQAELRDRGYTTSYCLVQTIDSKEGEAQFGNPEEQDVMFNIDGGLYPKDSKVYLFYRARLPVKEISAGKYNWAYAYDDLAMLKKHILEGHHDRLLSVGIETSYKLQQGSDAAFQFKSRFMSNDRLLPAEREFAANSLLSTMRLGHPEKEDEWEYSNRGWEYDTILLTLVELP